VGTFAHRLRAPGWGRDRLLDHLLGQAAVGFALDEFVGLDSPRKEAERAFAGLETEEAVRAEVAIGRGDARGGFRMLLSSSSRRDDNVLAWDASGDKRRHVEHGFVPA
jgi:hypothetical protein